MSTMLIGEVAEKTGLATSTIRYYESIGLLPEPERVNGRRTYDHDVIHQLTMIRAAQGASWSLAEIKEMFADFPDHGLLSHRWKARVPQKTAELDLIIEQAQKAKAILEAGMECDCHRITDCTLMDINSL